MTRTPEPRLGRTGRTTAALIAAGVVSLLGLSLRLEPDPRGYGTHTQLGLAPCAFRTRTGHPCPSCGMTTALAWAARGRLDRAWGANPAGAVLAPAGVVLAAWLLFAASTGRTPGTRSLEGAVIAVVVAAAGLVLAAWIVKLYLGRV